MKIKQNHTFKKLNDILDSHYDELKTKMEQGVLVYPASKTHVGEIIFSNLESGGIATFIVSGRNIWNPDSPYYRAQREAAQGGKKITRIFLVPHRRFIKEPLVQKHSELDRSAGIKVLFIHAGELISRKIILPPHTLDFGIWDKSIVCFIYYLNYEGNIVPYEWRISNRPEDLEFASSLADDILKNKDLIIDPTNKNIELDLEEPMLKSAPLMSMLSEVMCMGSQVDKKECSWYHRVWQYLRIFDIVSTPTWHYKFYIESIRRHFLSRKKVAILISGTADYSMLAHVLYALSIMDIEYEVTVLDLCQTPLILCEWYAKQERKKIITVQGDILKFNKKEYFDLIITDAFITRFSDNGKLRVLEKWNNLLKKDGMIITTARVDKESSSRVAKASDKEQANFVKKVFQSAQEWQQLLPESIENIKLWAKEYAEHMTSYPIKNKNLFCEFLMKSNFSVIEADEVSVKGEMHKTDYIELIAKKNNKT